MFALFVVTMLLTSVVSNGFKLPPKAKDFGATTALKSTISRETLNLPGKLPPTGFFDPLNLSADKSEETIKKWREAELKHGRVCMLSALGILVQETFNPMFGGKIIGPAINHFQQAETLFPPFWYLILLSIGIVEGYTIRKGWDKMETNGVANLRKDYIPGDLGFDPLNLSPSMANEKYDNLSDEFKEMTTKELQNGRLAMLATAGMVAQELVDGRELLEHYQLFGLGMGFPK